MRFGIALIVAGIAVSAPVFAQSGYYPNLNGPITCDSGYKLQRYSAGRPGNMGVHAVIPEDYGSAAGWYDIAGGPYEGDYRCVKADKPTAPSCDPFDPHEGDVAIRIGQCWVLMAGAHGGGGL